MSRSKGVIKKRLGFLLLEVLASITLISVGLAYISRSFSTSTRAIETATRFLESVSLVEEKMWELEAKGVVDKGKSDGRFKQDKAYKWEVEAKGLEEEVPINRVVLKVEWEGPQRRQRVSVETYLWNEED